MFTISRFIADCHSALATSDPALAVSEILADAIADPAAIDAELGPGDPMANESAQYDFLHQSPELTILRVIMPEYLQSPPHNHLVWAVIGMYRGREDNVFYRRQDDHIAATAHRNLFAPEVLVLPADTIHGIANPLPEQSFGLHVYGGTLANPARSLWDPFTLAEKPFQLPVMLQYEREMTERAVHNAL